MFKIHEQALPWTDITKWRWPYGDTKLVLVFKHVADIDLFMRYVEEPKICIQAGGAAGIWPLRFSQLFETVYTFEPQQDNYECLVFNTKLADNIIAYNAPLSNDYRKYVIKNDIVEKENYGAGYIIPRDDGIQSMLIDDLRLERCDLIQLDIEGYELEALKGGAKTIEQFKPTIVLEEKSLPHAPGDPAKPRKWLQSNFGYKLVDSVHRDVILVA